MQEQITSIILQPQMDGALRICSHHLMISTMHAHKSSTRRKRHTVFKCVILRWSIHLVSQLSDTKCAIIQEETTTYPSKFGERAIVGHLSLLDR